MVDLRLDDVGRAPVAQAESVAGILLDSRWRDCHGVCLTELSVAQASRGLSDAQRRAPGPYRCKAVAGVWVRPCLRKVTRCLKALLQPSTGQAKGLIPVWVRWCLYRVEMSVKAL